MRGDCSVVVAGVVGGCWEGVVVWSAAEGAREKKMEKGTRKHIALHTSMLYESRKPLE
jgi:hypothetical protein